MKSNRIHFPNQQNKTKQNFLFSTQKQPQIVLIIKWSQIILSIILCVFWLFDSSVFFFFFCCCCFFSSFFFFFFIKILLLIIKSSPSLILIHNNNNLLFILNSHSCYTLLFNIWLYTLNTNQYYQVNETGIIIGHHSFIVCLHL